MAAVPTDNVRELPIGEGRRDPPPLHTDALDLQLETPTQNTRDYHLVSTSRAPRILGMTAYG